MVFAVGNITMSVQFQVGDEIMHSLRSLLTIKNLINKLPFAFNWMNVHCK